MNNRITFSKLKLLFYLTISFYVMGCSKQESDFSESVKFSLREVGHHLLLTNNNSTSLVLPIVELEKSSFEISFESQLSIEPQELNSILKTSFEKKKLSINYRVFVFQCESPDFVYSYEALTQKTDFNIPCQKRVLPKDCYTIKIKFINPEKDSFFDWIQLLIYILVSIIVLITLRFYYRKKPRTLIKEENLSYLKLGGYQFYPDQLKLVYAHSEIALSKKECELLSILIDNSNQVVKREELSKRVWEDHGVFVGRSLDTFISKLRKKLKEDPNLKITNVHGVGYKLEM